jgi:hypothetical protein
MRGAHEHRPCCETPISFRRQQTRLEDVSSRVDGCMRIGLGVRRLHALILIVFWNAQI